MSLQCLIIPEVLATCPTLIVVNPSVRSPVFIVVFLASAAFLTVLAAVWKFSKVGAEVSPQVGVVGEVFVADRTGGGTRGTGHLKCEGEMHG